MSPAQAKYNVLHLWYNIKVILKNTNNVKILKVPLPQNKMDKTEILAKLFN